MSERLYKTIDNTLLKKLNIKTTRNYKFKKFIIGQGFKTFPLHEKSEGKEKFYSLDDSNANETWDWSTDDVIMDIKIQINNCTDLFCEGGVVESDARIGIGLVWHSQNSRIKNCQKVGEIDKNNTAKIFEVMNVKLENLSSTTDFSLIFYIKEPGSIDINSCIGNEEGLIVGEYNLFTLVGEGIGSVFPICISKLDSHILWKYNCNYSNIAEDEFSEENILVILNSKHKLYKYYEVQNESYNADMLNSLLSHILTILIMDIRNKEGGTINLDNDANKGSILSVLQYYNNTLGIKINAPFDELFVSVQKFIYEGCKI